MPSTVTAYDVRIVSLGDGGLASHMAREVLAEWNSVHVRQEKLVLVPLQDARETPGPADLLIAFYCPSRAVPGCGQVARMEAEIESYVTAGRPVLVYCSDAREDLHKQETEATPEWIAFQSRFQSKVVLASFGDEKEFRSGLARQLVETVRTHAYFKGEANTPSETAPVARPTLSKLAQTLLMEACADPEAYIGRVQDGSGLKIQANGKQLVEPGASAVWEKAFAELVSGGYVRDAGCQGRLFQISAAGFAFLKSIGVSPVGYIAELGGM